MNVKYFLCSFIFFANYSFAQVELNADGPGGTYELITSVLAPGYNPIEVPDCNHIEFGNHIDEVFDNDLNKNVFRFHIHTTPDNDRCINFDRQRNEIKTYDQSPDNLLGVENETVVYKWKFKLDEGFQSSPNFTHIHQLKPVGGSLASMPMYTLTTRKSNPDRLELRYVETETAVTLKQEALAPFINTWLEVTETITYGISGTYDIEIKKVSDGTVLFDYSNDSIINWRDGASFVRPKWGIYRSLDNAQDLRDEIVLFADFSIEEIDVSTSIEEEIKNDKPIVFINSIENFISIKELNEGINLIQIFNMEGKIIMDTKIDSVSELIIDTTSFSKGSYIINFTGEQINQSELVLIK